jgi:hypothetical protein
LNFFDLVGLGLVLRHISINKKRSSSSHVLSKHTIEFFRIEVSKSRFSKPTIYP